MENERVWRPRMASESVETKDGERESLETKDGDREITETKDGDRETTETSRARQECRVQKQLKGLHRTLDSPVNFGPGEEVPHLGSGAAHRRATSITGISGMAAVGGASIGSGTWVNQESQTLDPEWRDPAGRAQKGNNGSRRPYIRPQSAGSWISPSQGVKPSRSIRYQSEQSNKQIIYKGETARRVAREAAPWEPTRSKIATSRRSGLGYQESPN